MDWQRTLLLGLMAAVAFMLLLEWNDFQEQKKPAATETFTLPSDSPLRSPLDLSSNTDEVPSDTSVPMASDEIPTSPEESQETKTVRKAQLISIKTDALEVKIDTLGGDIVKVALPQYAASLDTPHIPFELLNRRKNHTYVAQSGLIGPDGTDKSKHKRPVFQTAKTHYELLDGQDTLVVDLLLTRGDVTLTKRFRFQRNDYLIDVEYLIDNQSDNVWKANLFTQIKRDSHAPQVDAGFGMQPYLGAAITTDKEHFKKLDFADLEEASFSTSITGGWVAMVQHYFLSAWIPDQETKNQYSLRKVKGQDLYLLGYTSQSTVVEPGKSGLIKASFYAGPKDVYRLEEISPYLDLTVDYGWLWWIAKPLFYLLNWIYNLLGNWGWSIVMLTVFVKAVFYPLSAASYRSMASMRKVQPLMMELKERYGDNRQKMSEEVMKLYRKEKVNPLGGCLPVLVQMPVFIALYWVLMESVELRHTPFLGWINDLSVKDPFFILPLIMGVTMFIQQKLNPMPPDPMQAKVMQMMPIIFTFMFMWFPAGLVLYWVVNNTLSIAQQYWITRQIEAASSK